MWLKAAVLPLHCFVWFIGIRSNPTHGRHKNNFIDVASILTDGLVCLCRSYKGISIKLLKLKLPVEGLSVTLTVFFNTFMFQWHVMCFDDVNLSLWIFYFSTYQMTNVEKSAFGKILIFKYFADTLKVWSTSETKWHFDTNCCFPPSVTHKHTHETQFGA